MMMGYIRLIELGVCEKFVLRIFIMYQENRKSCVSSNIFVDYVLNIGNKKIYKTL